MNSRQPVVEIIDPMMVEILRNKSPAQRLAQAFGMWDFAVMMLSAVIRQEQPELSTSEVQRAIYRRIRGSAAP